jgi:DNA-binding MarR family transcriptional regulator
MAHGLPDPQRKPSQQRQADLGIVGALAQLSFLVQGTLSKQAATHDLSMIQTRLLGVLRDREPTMQELSRLLKLDKSSVTGLIDRAEKRGLVRRTPSIDDRRAIRVQMTLSGRRIVNDVVDAFQTDISSATECLSSVDKKRLSSLATKMVREYEVST